MMCFYFVCTVFTTVGFGEPRFFIYMSVCINTTCSASPFYTSALVLSDHSITEQFLCLLSARAQSTLTVLSLY